MPGDWQDSLWSFQQETLFPGADKLEFSHLRFGKNYSKNTRCLFCHQVGISSLSREEGRGRTTASELDGMEGGLKQASQRDSLHLGKPGFLNLMEISLSTFINPQTIWLVLQSRRLGGRIPRGSLIESGSDKHCFSVSLTIQVVVASGSSRSCVAFLVCV